MLFALTQNLLRDSVNIILVLLLPFLPFQAPRHLSPPRFFRIKFFFPQRPLECLFFFRFFFLPPLTVSSSFPSLGGSPFLSTRLPPLFQRSPPPSCPLAHLYCPLKSPVRPILHPSALFSPGCRTLFYRLRTPLRPSCPPYSVAFLEDQPLVSLGALPR